MQAAIGYLRVRTREQGGSGLGLASQRFEIDAVGAREGFSVKSWYQDVQTGAARRSSSWMPPLPLKHLAEPDRGSRRVEALAPALQTSASSPHSSRKAQSASVQTP